MGEIRGTNLFEDFSPREILQSLFWPFICIADPNCVFCLACGKFLFVDLVLKYLSEKICFVEGRRLYPEVLLII